MVLLVLVVLAGIGLAIYEAVEEDVVSGFLGGLAWTAAGLAVGGIVVIVISCCLPEENLFHEVTSSIELVENADGKYIVEDAVNGKEYYLFKKLTDRGITNGSVKIDNAYIIYDENPRIEHTECVGFRKAKYYIYAIPQACEDYYTIYIPEGGG